MSLMTFRFPLNDPNCSGRGVQCKVLTGAEVREVYLAVAKMDASAEEKGLALPLEGVKRMVTHVTKEPLQGPVDEAAMVPVTLQNFESPSSDLHFDKLFNGKDVEELTALYGEYHQMSPKERESLTTKVVIVSLG